MCRLLGVKSSQQNKIHDLLCECERPFKNFGMDNPDGWGIGWYENNRPLIYKEDVAAHESDELPKYAKCASSTLFISHVRKGSGTSVCVKNCHPFHYGHWIFAHNGFVTSEPITRQLSKPHIEALQGDTDSEVYFHWLLQSIDSAYDVALGVENALDMVRRDRHTALNFILTDGESLYAYRESDERQDYFSLFVSEIASLDINAKRRIIVCSERITADNWVEIPMKKLLVIGKDMTVRWKDIR